MIEPNEITKTFNEAVEEAFKIVLEQTKKLCDWLKSDECKELIKEMEKEQNKKMKEITLGVYNSTPIEWLVLKEDEKSYTLISKYILEIKKEEELEKFLYQYMKPRLNLDVEKIYLLSVKEIEKYFPQRQDKVAYLEPEKYGKPESSTCGACWWTRTPTDSMMSNLPANECVTFDGWINCRRVNENCGVRPTIKILKSKIEKSQHNESQIYCIKKIGISDFSNEELIKELSNRLKFNESN